MDLGIYMSGIILTIMSILFFQEGGIGLVIGVICALVVIFLGWLIFKEDTEQNNGGKD